MCRLFMCVFVRYVRSVYGSYELLYVLMRLYVCYACFYVLLCVCFYVFYEK